MKIGIVVLNYIKYQETINCVESILAQRNVDTSIVIVDNGSNNDSYNVLFDKYNKFKNIQIIGLDTNLGYAKGNNIGIKKLREKNIDFIIVANSDICFSTENVLAQIYTGYEKNVGLIVPTIKNLDGSIEQRVVYKKKYLVLRIIKKILQINFFIHFNKKAKKERKVEKIDSNKELKGLIKDSYVVSGSAFLLTPDFFNYYNGLYPETFLYFEEWATILYLNKAKLYSKIIETDTIVHKGAASSYSGSDADKIKLKYMKQSSKKIFKLIFYKLKHIKERYK